MPLPPEQEQSLTVRLPMNLHAAVKERSEQEERTIAQTIRFALRMYLDTSPSV